ncbi:MAG: hypothetical protein IPJ06_17590 [Saprospiraceae bacterium]|nr:hypothetical protein [Saprospiraceae bacterium]
MQFNIIYTPYTVRPLNLFLVSLIHHTSVRLQLVSNACPRDEVDLLHGLASLAPERVEVLIHPSSTMLPHPVLLNELQEIEVGPYFAFMDSDILACGDIQPILTTFLQDYSAVFSGSPIWADRPVLARDQPKAGGRFMITEDGFCLGGTYFAIYNNEHVNRIRKAFGMSFNHSDWDDIPSDIQQIIRQMDLVKERYDNAKVMNILLQHEGHSCTYTEDLPIVHYGGLSRYLTVLSRQEAAMAYHKEHRGGQQKMREQAEYLAQALLDIHDDKPIPPPGHRMSSTLSSTIRESLEECFSLRQEYRTVLQQIGL